MNDTTAGWLPSIGPIPNEAAFRYDKTIQLVPNEEHLEYPAVTGIWGRDQRDELHRFADLVHFLEAKGRRRRLQPDRLATAQRLETTAGLIFPPWKSAASRLFAPGPGPISKIMKSV